MEAMNLLNEFKQRNIFLDRDDILDFKKMSRNDLNFSAFLMPDLDFKYNFGNIEVATMQNIGIRISQMYGIDVDMLLYDKSRKTEVREPRQIAHFFSRVITKESLATIGRYFGDRDHSTVINSTNVVANEFEVHPNIANVIHMLCYMFNVNITRVYKFIEEMRVNNLKIAS